MTVQTVTKLPNSLYADFFTKIYILYIYIIYIKIEYEIVKDGKYVILKGEYFYIYI